MTFFISFPGHSSDVRHFGGTPYFMGQALRQAGVDCDYLDLPNSDGAIRCLRYAWNAAQMLALRGLGGFQYSPTYLNLIWRNMPALTQDDVLISIFQLMSQSALASPARKVFYFDLTLHQLFEYYGLPISIAAQRRAIASEIAGYEAADLILCTSQWTADDVIGRYGIPASKVDVVIPGANVAAPAIPYLLDSPGRVDPAPGAKVRVLFVGTDPLRKGLYRFLDALATLPELRDRVAVDIVGLSQGDIAQPYQQLSNLVFHGYIDKGRDMQRFCDLMLQADVGLLLSTAEAGGLSLREFQMAGLPVIAPNVGGTPEWVAPGAGLLIDRDASTDDIALLFKRLVLDGAALRDMRKAAREARESMSWAHAAQAIKRAISPLLDSPGDKEAPETSLRDYGTANFT